MATFHPDCHDLECNEKPESWFKRLLRRVWREVVQDCEYEDLDRYRPYRVEQDDAVEVSP